MALKKKLKKHASRVTLIKRHGGVRTASVIVKTKNRPGPGPRPGPSCSAENLVRGFVSGQSEFASEYLKLHADSNAGRPNGWIADAPVNFLAAQQKAIIRAREVASGKP